MRIEMETKHNLLIVEDEKAISNLIATTLETQGYHYEKASNGAQAMLAVTSTARRSSFWIWDCRIWTAWISYER